MASRREELHPASAPRGNASGGPLQVRIRELALCRYAERFEHPSVRRVGRRMRLELGRELFSVDAPPGAGLAVVIEGRREFGGFAVFDLPEAVHRVEAGEPEELQRAAEQLVEMLAGLCLCGRFPGDCDCCQSCAGRGYLRGGEDERAQTCWRCAGMGYVPRELRDSGGG